MKTSKNMKRAALALVIATLTASSWGQVQQVQQGRALDANPLVGSGGSNQPVQGYVPINGNDIVSGNVAGLKAWHGTVDTIAPYEFHGPTASSNFYNFARQSAGGLQTTPTSANQVFYLPSNMVSTAQGSIYSSPYGNGYDSRIIPGSSISPTASGPIASRAGGAYGGIPLRAFNTPASTGTVEQGRAISSSLFGMRQSTPLGQDDANAQKNSTTPGTNGNNPKNDVNNDLDNPDAPKKSADGSQGAQVDASVQGKVNGRVNGQTQDMQNTLASNQQWQDNQASQMRLSTTYRDLQAKLDKAKDEQAKADKDKEGTTGAQANASDASARSSVPGTEVPKKDAAGNPIRERPDAGSGSLAETGRNGNRLSPTDQSIDPSKPGYRPRSAVISRANPLDETPTSVLRAGKKVEPLKSYTVADPGANASKFDKYMKDGESLLKSGKYFDAADVYQSALALQPNDPLALMGRANAELGGGMYLSAAYDLQMVFASKPDMVSVRYSLENYIPPERQSFLVNDLQSLTTSEDTGNAASFLLCYLCYNTGRVDDLQAELGRWQARPWHNSWSSVLQRAWGQ